MSDEGSVTIPCNPDDVSDGYHTFKELYEHRHRLFIALMLASPGLSWRSWKHDDGTMFDGYFIAGMGLRPGTITYHLPARLWSALDNGGIQTLETAREWDGHTSDDVLFRLAAWAPNQEGGG